MQTTSLFGRTPQFVPSILALFIVISVFASGASVSFSHESLAPALQGNPPIDWPNGTSYSKSVNPFTAAGWGNQCTAFAWGRAYEVTGIKLPFRGDGNTWISGSFAKGFEPRANSIAVWEGDKTNPHGHVAFVENVSGNLVYFSEANILTFRTGGGYDGNIKQRTKDQLLNRGTGVGKLLGYVYFASNASKPPASLKTVLPNGGERWPIGSTQTIRWTYTGDQASVGGGVSIEVLLGNTVVYTVPASIIIGANGSGSFRWTIPASLIPDSNYKVRIVSSMKVSDLSDQNFTLVGPRIVVSSSLQLSPGDKEPRVGQPLKGSFTITNRGNTEAVLNRIVIGGLFNGKCLIRCPDFTPSSLRIRLAPGRSYNYSGLYIPIWSGEYTFLVAYQKPDGKWEKPVEAEIGKTNELTVTVRSLFAKSEKRGSALVKWFPDEKDDGRIPLILIHGIHGSDHLDAITDKGPEKKAYWKVFLKRFNGELKETYSLYAFQYYSDQDGVQELARQLGKSIDERFGNRPHVLLAHSMGGLVAKSYMVDHGGGSSTLLLITLATPHHGTPGANDVDALKEQLGDGWDTVFSVVNFIYWTSAAGFRSPPAQSSDAPNRSDLRWDNYNNLISSDSNAWLGTANQEFKGYSSKVIAYAGALRASDMSLVVAIDRLLRLIRYEAIAKLPLIESDKHGQLAFANNIIVNGLKGKFGGTDGLVPYRSAALCNHEPAQTIIASPTYLCSSPTRVRRFEPGSSVKLTPDAQTLSIDRRPGGYDHLHMLEDPDVLYWVVKDLAIGPKPLVTASLQFSPTAAYQVGQPINGSFTITNRGKTDLFMQRVVIGGRLAGTCPNNQCPDFGPAPTNITLRPYESYNYAGTFTPTLTGNYTFAVAYENAGGKWTMPVEAENGNKNQLSIAVTSNQPNVVVSKSLTLTPGAGPFPIGQAVNGTFSITNRGSVALTMRQVLIGGRLSGNCPNNVCPDFSPVGQNITLNPGQAFDYSGRIILSQPGSYTFYVAYQTPDGKWEMPVKTDRGAINQVSILVQPPGPVLTNVSPASVSANANAQVINLYGTRLGKVIYAGVRLPDGTLAYLYIPLNQVFRVSDSQVRISAKFLRRGTYHVTVWTADGKSNEYPIIVY